MNNNLNNTPSAERVHIAVFGRTNSGKSTLINTITLKEISIVSSVKGTTTDPVYKAMEIAGIGACVIIDTAGFDDESENLGALRVEKTKSVIDKTDIAIILIDAYDTTNDYSIEIKWIEKLKKRNTPVIAVINKVENITDYKTDEIEAKLKVDTISISAKENKNIDKLIELIKKHISSDDNTSIVGHLINKDDIVVLVMPQDIQAPKGRLILPQVQTIRDILENKCIVVASTFDCFTNAINSLIKPPKLIITDSQMFKQVQMLKPKESLLTSFSVLFARYKGDEKIYKEGALYIDSLSVNSKILIAESCTHRPLEEDIGRVKIPNLIKAKKGNNIKIDVVSGNLPDNIDEYNLIIHCGGCMATRKEILNRIYKAKEKNIPITNYGMAIAKLTGVEYV